MFFWRRSTDVQLQSGYGLKEKRFSLFNTGRWLTAEDRPSVVHVVPLLYAGDFTTEAIDEIMDALAYTGSAAAHGFMRPEGIIVYHSATGTLFKRTFENDDTGKEAA